MTPRTIHGHKEDRMALLEHDSYTASVALALIAATVPVQAQETASDTARAIKELTSEVRGLRTAIEHSAQSQLQGQVLGLYLNLQQNRVTQATARLDDVRRELEGVSGRARELAQQESALEVGSPRRRMP